MTLKVDSVVGEDGTSPVTLTGQAAARAWANYDQTTPVLIDSLNVSSADDDGAGDFGINYTSAFSSTEQTASTAAVNSPNVDVCFGTLGTSSSEWENERSTDATARDGKSGITIIGDLA